MRPSRRALPVAVLTATLLLGACSDDHETGDHMDEGSESTTSLDIPDDATFTAADVTFAQGMILHHAQAVQMADLALATSENTDVLSLATAIAAAQGPEIEQMTGWLEEWGQPVPETGDDAGMEGMDGMEGGSGTSGMMTAAEMTQLADASGAAFDRMFLELMIRHHQGAIVTALDEVKTGEDPAARALAQDIITAQQAEIDQMDELLADLAD